MTTFLWWFTAANPDLVVNADMIKDHALRKLAAAIKNDFSDLYNQATFHFIYESLRVQSSPIYFLESGHNNLCHRRHAFH